MKKILLVVDERKMGGVSILLEDLINNMNLKNKDIDILVLHNNGDRLENIKDKVNIIYGTKFFDAVDIPIKEVIKSHNIGLIFRKIRLVFDMKTGLIKRRIIKERKKILTKKYDTEIAFKDGFTALFVGFGDCSNKIHWLHYDYHNKKACANTKYDKLFKKVLPIFNEIIAVSKGVMDDFNNLYHLENKTRVIGNFIDIKKIKSSVNINKPKQKSNKLYMISVGRLHPQKGYDRLIEAFHKLDQEQLLKNVEFHLYGDGPEEEALKNSITRYGLNDIMILEGRTNNPYEKVLNSDLFILPSVYETFGLVMVEAMTLHVPVLATNNPATGELIDNNKNGLIVDNSINGLYEGLKEIINNTHLIVKWQEALKNYDYNENNKKIIKEVEDILS